MAKLYVKKIKSKAYNKNTGEAWKLADVPPTWYAEVEALLQEV